MRRLYVIFFNGHQSVTIVVFSLCHSLLNVTSYGFFDVHFLAGKRFLIQ